MSPRLVPPPPDDPENWIRLLNFLYLHEQDQLFVWLRGVRQAVEEAEARARDSKERAA